MAFSNGSLGLGAVIAATVLHRVRARFSADQILAASTLYNVAVLLILAYVRSPWVIIAALILSGSAWTSTMSTIKSRCSWRFRRGYRRVRWEPI